jgi:hypothetical protein
MDLDKAKAFTDIATAWIGVAALVLGGSFAIIQYFDKKDDDRVKETLEFLDRYNKKPFWDARESLANAWEKHADEEKVHLAKSTAAEYNKFLLDVIRGERLEGSIQIVIDFYAALDACVKKGICDEQSATGFFKDEAQAHYQHSYPYIESQRKDSDQSFGGGLQRFGK